MNTKNNLNELAQEISELEKKDFVSLLDEIKKILERRFGKIWQEKAKDADYLFVSSSQISEAIRALSNVSPEAFRQN